MVSQTDVEGGKNRLEMSRRRHVGRTGAFRSRRMIVGKDYAVSAVLKRARNDIPTAQFDRGVHPLTDEFVSDEPACPVREGDMQSLA